MNEDVHEIKLKQAMTAATLTFLSDTWRIARPDIEKVLVDLLDEARALGTCGGGVNPRYNKKLIAHSLGQIKETFVNAAVKPVGENYNDLV